MIFGYNTDVKSGDTVFHVQTEDRGERNPVIDSVIYVKGRIVDRRRTAYSPGENTPEKLQDMVKRQHRELVDSIKNGSYVAPGQAETAAPAAAPAAEVAPPPAPTTRVEPAAPALELTNAREIDGGNGLRFLLRVRNRATGEPLPGVVVRAVLAGGIDDEQRREVRASDDGTVEIRFEMPAARGAQVAAMFQAEHGGSSEMVKFRLQQE